MKHLKKLLAVAAVTLALAAVTVTSWAATVYASPAEAAAGVTGQTAEEVQALRNAGKSYGAIAADAGKLEEYQLAILDMRRAALDEQVADGILTQAEADALVDAVATRQALCDGTGSCDGTGIACTQHQSTGHHGNGGGHGHGRGNGTGRRSGGCHW